MKLSKDKIEVREVNSNDIKDIYKWRNHDLTRPMMHNTKPITWKSHNEWFNKSIKNPKQYSLICYNTNEKKIGIVSFNLFRDYAVISIIIDPVLRGKKISFYCLKKSIKFFSNKFDKIKIIKAEIKNFNESSKKIFIKTGFILKEEKKDIMLFELNLKNEY